MVAISVSYCDFGFMSFEGFPNLVGFTEIEAIGFLNIDAFGSVFTSGYDHGCMLVWMPWADRYNIRAMLLQKFPEVGVAVFGFELVLGFLQTGGIAIGDSDDLCLWKMHPHCIQTMAKVTTARVAKYANRVELGLRNVGRESAGREEGSCLKKGSSLHVFHEKL